MRLQPRWWHEEKSAAGTLGQGAGRAACCGLCHRNCMIADGASGFCGVRSYSAESGFRSPYLGRFAACAVDPIEKKPLYHWRPGTQILSLGSIGCNLSCPFCQNYRLVRPQQTTALREILPEALLDLVKETELSAVAYTYNEPTLQAEYIFAAAPLLRENGVASVMVTNGMFSPDLLDEAAAWVEAMNVDVKTFDEDVYARIGGSLARVRANVEGLVTRGVHVELTSLIVPGVSDSVECFEAMISWIAGLSPDIPLHIARYYPAYKFTAPPTDVSLMRRFQDIASGRLRYVHLGNI